jgi:hypothetical protein
MDLKTSEEQDSQTPHISTSSNAYTRAPTHPDPEHPKLLQPTYPRTTPDPPPGTKPDWPRLSDLDNIGVMVQHYKLTKRLAADREAVDSALTRLEMANAVFAEARISFATGGVAEYFRVFNNVQEASSGIHEPQRAYRASLALLRLFIAEMADLMPAASMLKATIQGQLISSEERASEAEENTREVLAGISGAVGKGGAKFATEMFLYHVRKRVRNLEADEKQLMKLADLCLQIREEED